MFFLILAVNNHVVYTGYNKLVQLLLQNFVDKPLKDNRAIAKSEK
jgi:hypothetical protein